MDAARASGLIDYLVSAGVPVPSTVLKVISKIFNIFHVDGVMIMSNTQSIDAATQSALETAVKAKIPKFTVAKSVYKFVKTTCV